MMKRVALVAGLASGLVLAACDVTSIGQKQDDAAGTDVSEQVDTGTETGDQLADADTPTDPVTPADSDDGSDAETTVGTASVTKKADIDWEAARNDLASAPESDEDQSFNIQSGSTAPPVPVLLPTMNARPAGATDGPQPQFRPVPDGYFAVFPGAKYTLIVNGTNEVTDAPGMEPVDPESMTYSETTTGAIVSFSRYGADYMVEFECMGSGEEGGDCIDRDEALTVANEIVISGTQ